MKYSLGHQNLLHFKFELADAEYELPPNSQIVPSPIPANVWQILIEKGAEVKAGDRLVILGSMKMEFTITAPIQVG